MEQEAVDVSKVEEDKMSGSRKKRTRAKLPSSDASRDDILPKDLLYRLLPELRREVVSFLPRDEILNMRLVCKLWCKVATDTITKVTVRTTEGKDHVLGGNRKENSF